MTKKMRLECTITTSETSPGIGEIKVNPDFLTGTFIGGGYGVACGLLAGPIGLIGVAAAFGGAAIGSGIGCAISGQRIAQYCPPSQPYKPEPPKKNINFQKVGYVRAMRWNNPLTTEQEIHLCKLFGDGAAFDA